MIERIVNGRTDLVMDYDFFVHPARTTMKAYLLGKPTFNGKEARREQ